MPSVVKLDLPHPSHELTQAVYKFAETAFFDENLKRHFEEFYKNSINMVHYTFHTADLITDLVKQEYQSIFTKHKVTSWVGIFKNTTESPACFPIHSDRSRGVGLNYFLSLGGSHVRSVFYDRVEPVDGQIKLFNYDELAVVEEYVSDSNQWYCYDVQRCHSVENIQGTRLFLAIKLSDPNSSDPKNLDYNATAFQKDYPHLVVGS